MTSSFLDKYASRRVNFTKSRPKAQDISHLYMNEKDLEIIDITAPCHKLKVLYLHNNRIKIISNLETFQCLTHLYLQWNKLMKIENLDSLRNLRKLYLGYNQIRRLENIERLQNLQELYIEKQDIGDVEFTFDFYSLKAIARNLLILNVSKLNLTTLEPLSILLRLKYLIATENEFRDGKDLGNVLGRMPFIEKADLYDCPAQKDTHYREKIIAGSYNLEFLDGKFITPQNRTFIKRFEQVKSERRTKSETDTKLLRKESNDMKSKLKPVQSLNLKNSTVDEISFRAWNSLNFIQKPMRHALKRQSDRPKTEYSLQGRHIVK